MKKLGELSLDIRYKEGPLNVLADMLPRQPRLRATVSLLRHKMAGNAAVHGI